MNHYFIIIIEFLMLCLICVIWFYPRILKKREEEKAGNIRRKDYESYLRSECWEKFRQEALERAACKCELCGAPYQSVHHVKYPKQYPDDHIDNLLVVCGRCHALLHGIREQAVPSDETSLFPEEVRVGSHSYSFSIINSEGNRDSVEITESGTRGSFSIKIPFLYLDIFDAALVRCLSRCRTTGSRIEEQPERIVLDNRTCIFEIRTTVNGHRYMKITENRRTGVNVFERNSVIVFEDGIDMFSAGYGNFLRKLRNSERIEIS